MPTQQDLVNRYSNEDSNVQISAPIPPGVNHRPEMPRFLIRHGIVCFAAVTFVLVLLSFWLMPNPLGRIADPRMGEQAYDTELTSIAAAQTGPQRIWLGSMGKGLRTFEPNVHLFGRDFTTVNPDGALLSNFVLDVEVSRDGDGLGALVVAGDESRAVTGLQVFGATSGDPDFWEKPLIGLNRFPGLADDTASCIAATSDGSRLVVGTRGHGLGVYEVGSHSWTEILTAANGLPSNLVHDLVTVTPPDPDQSAWLYVATDLGIVAGQLSIDAKFERQIAWTASTGLAGNDVRELQFDGGNVWYRTGEKGLGRIAVSESGEPTDAGLQVLVTENRVPGLRDETLSMAVSAMGGPTTWFASRIGPSTSIGRYREFPHDIQAVPSSTPVDEIHAMAAPDSGSRAYLGTENGVWSFSDSAEGISETASGPAGVPVHEIALASESRVLVKARSPDGIPHLLYTDSGASGGPWNWNSLVGAGRFSGLESMAGFTCVSGTGKRLFFGTEGLGIGQWNRDSMEMVLYAQSSGKLRHDTSLDLAESGDNLIQVTGDLAVDILSDEARNLRPLVPPSSAAIRPDSLQFAAANDHWLVLADPNQISGYDVRSFQWTDLPELPGLIQLEIVGERIWALDRAGALRTLDLANAAQGWSGFPGVVRSLTLNQTHLFALTQLDSFPASVRTYDGASGSEGPSLEAGALSSSGGSWNFAAGLDDDLLLAGTDGIHRYDPDARAWEVIQYPNGFGRSLQWAQANRKGFWLLDGDGRMERYSFADRSLESVAENIEGAFVSNDSVLLLQADGPETPRATVLSPAARTVVGRSFDGDIGQTVDAMELNGRLLTLAPRKVGIYSWDSHDWNTIPQNASNLTRLIPVGNALWAEGGNRLFRWDGEQFQPVTDSTGEQLSIKKAVAGSQGLFALSGDGRVFECAVDSPVLNEVFPATSVGGRPSIEAERTAFIGGKLILADSSGLLEYSPASGGQGRWRTVEVDGRIRRLIQPPNQKYLLEERSDGVFVRLASNWEAVPIRPGKESDSPKGGIAATDGLLAAGFQRPDERGLRVRYYPTTGGGGRDLIGDPLPDRGATLQVREVSGTDQLLRLSERGQLAAYDPGTRHWTVQASSSSYRSLHEVNGTLLGWAPGTKTIAPASAIGSDNEEAVSFQDSAIERISFFRRGALIHFDDGGLARLDRISDEPVVHRKGNTAGPGVDLSSLVQVAEPSANVIVMLNESGEVAGFDWKAQEWLRSSGFRGIKVIVEFDGEFYFRDEDQALHGPIRVADGKLAAESQQLDVRQHLEIDDELFAIAQNGAFHWFEDGWRLVGEGRPFGGLGEIRLIESTPLFRVYYDENRNFVAWHFESKTWVKFEGKGFVLGRDLFVFDDGRVKGPVRPDKENPNEFEAELFDNRPLEEEEPEQAATDAPPEESPDEVATVSFRRIIIGEGNEVYLDAGDEAIFEFTGTEIRPTEAELPDADETAEMTVVPGIEEFGIAPKTGADWRLVEGTLERRFNGGFVTLPASESGFGFERWLAAEIVDDEVLVYTPSGRLRFRNTSEVVPTGFEPGITLPDGLDSGRIVEFSESRLLIPENGDGPGWEWQGEGWVEIDEALREAFVEQPFLKSKNWTWRATPEGEMVEYRVGNGVETSTFERSKGRFDRDHVRAIGQAKGQAWVLTDAGVYRLTANGLDMTSRFDPEDGDGLGFLDSTSDLPGGLGRDGIPVWIYTGQEWVEADEGQGTEDSLTAVRLTAPGWQINRDGSILRALPQAPGELVEVAIESDGRWNFESVKDLVAAGGNCHLATAAGLVRVRGGEVAEFWPFEGGAERLWSIDGSLAATLSDGSQLIYDGNGWKSGKFDESDQPVIREGDRFRVTRFPEGGVTFEVRRTPGSEFAEIESAGGRFAFDKFQSAAVRDGGALLAASEEGVIEIDSSGDVRPIGEVTEVGARFFSALNEDSSDLDVFLEAGGQFRRFAGVWSEVDPSEGQAASDRAAALLVSNSRWKVSRDGGGGLEVVIRLEEDPGGPRSVEFQASAGGFDFDQFLSAAPAEDTGTKMIVGTAAGAQRTSLERESLAPERFWRSEETDGLNEGPVATLFRSGGGIVFAGQNGQVLKLAANGGRFAVSGPDEFTTQRIRRAADAEGWNMDLTAPGQFDLSWKGEPVYLLIDPADNRSRFAHNRIRSAVFIGDQLILGTEGGLVRVNRDLTLEGFELVSQPFEGMSGNGLIWMIPDPASQVIWGRDDQGNGWRINPANGMNSVRSEFPAGESLQSLNALYRDDLLVWREHGHGAVEVEFSQEFAQPIETKPEVAGGTFTFLQIGGFDITTTLVSSGERVFASSEAGILEFDRESLAPVRLHAGTGGGEEALGGGADLFFRREDGELFASIPGGSGFFRFESGTGFWVPTGSDQGDPFDGRDLIGDSPMLTWKATSDGGISVEVKETDETGREFFGDGGKPAMDEIHGFTFRSRDAGGHEVILGTDGGIPAFDAGNFNYLQTEQAGFADPAAERVPVAEIAAVESAEGATEKLVARNPGGMPFLWNAENGWQPGDEEIVASAFAESYRCVRQEDRWYWARYPKGLTCTLLHTNGNPLELGGIPVEGLDPVFAGGGLAVDQVKSVVFDETGELLASGPVGIIRFEIDPDTRRVVGEQIDVWSESGGRIPLFTRMERDDRAVTSWGEIGSFSQGRGAPRKWVQMPPIANENGDMEALDLRYESETWRAWRKGLEDDESELGVRFGDGGIWTTRADASDFVDATRSPAGLWILYGNEVYFADKRRIKVHPRHWFGF